MTAPSASARRPLALGIAIDLLIFSPLERRVPRNRGLTVDRD